MGMDDDVFTEVFGVEVRTYNLRALYRYHIGPRRQISNDSPIDLTLASMNSTVTVRR